MDVWDFQNWNFSDVAALQSYLLWYTEQKLQGIAD